jgi:enterochelin esterase-like enzyme
VDLVANPEFADFMAKELVPWVRSHYNITKDQKQIVLTGYSAGGLASTVNWRGLLADGLMALLGPR